MTNTNEVELAAEYEAAIQQRAEAINTLLINDIVELIEWLLETPVLESERLVKLEGIRKGEDQRLATRAFKFNGFAFSIQETFIDQKHCKKWEVGSKDVSRDRVTLFVEDYAVFSSVVTRTSVCEKNLQALRTLTVSDDPEHISRARLGDWLPVFLDAISDLKQSVKKWTDERAIQQKTKFIAAVKQHFSELTV